MKRLIAVLIIAMLTILMVATVVVSYLGGSRRLDAVGRQATTLELAVDGVNRAETRQEIGALQPADLSLMGYRVHNTGTQAGRLAIVELTRHNSEHGCEPEEREAGDLTCGDPGDDEGELDQVVLMRLFRDAGCDFVLNAGDQFLHSNELSLLSTPLDANVLIAPGAEVCLIFAFEQTRSSHLTSGARVAGDTLSIDLVFELSP